MTVSSSTNRVSYSGNGTLTVFAYTFKVFDEGDLTVILRASNGTETVQTITTHYTVSGVGDAGGGNITFVTAPTATETVVILREQPLTQGLDLVPNDPFPAQSLEEALDKVVFMTQKHEEELGRAIKASRTNTLTGSEFTISAADRANKVFSFDASGDLAVTQELGVWQGNWATATAFSVRDIVKDASNNNVYICITAHTSSGSTPISTNTDSAKWALLVDSASATASAAAAAASETAAAASETAAAASETAAAASETAAAASETAAAASETNAAASEAAAAASYDSFDDRYLGAKATDPTVDNDGDALIDGALYFDTTNNAMKVYDLGGTAWNRTAPTTSEQTNINTVSSISADVTTVATNVTDVNSFANTYKISASEPSSPTEGMLWYDSTNDIVKVYNGSSFQNSGATVNGVSARDNYTATGGQTNFSSSYDPTFLDVYLNGVKLLNGTDFTATDGSTVVLTSGASAGDLIEIVAFGSFNLTDTYSTRDALGLGSSDSVTFSSVSATLTGNVTGDLTGNVTGNLTGNVTGDVTGDITGNVTGNVTGNLTGNVTGNVTGDVTGNVTGNVTVGTTNHGTFGSNFFTLQASDGQIQTLTLSQNTVIAPSLSNGESVILMVADGTGNYSATWSGLVFANNDGLAPTLINTGYNTFTIWKVDNVNYIAYAGDQ